MDKKKELWDANDPEVKTTVTPIDVVQETPVKTKKDVEAELKQDRVQEEQETKKAQQKKADTVIKMASGMVKGWIEHELNVTLNPEQVGELENVCTMFLMMTSLGLQSID